MSTDANVGSNPTARTSNQGDIVEEFNVDILTELKVYALLADREVGGIIFGNGDFFRLVSSEIERLHLLITNWMDAEYDDNCEDPSYYHQDVAEAWQALREAVGR